MASACCPHWPCSCDQLLKSEQFAEEAGCEKEKEKEEEEEELTDTVPLARNMDISRLKEQYNSIREKRKRESTVIYFAKASSTNEEISGKSLVVVVPMRQARHTLVRQASVQETQFDFVRDPDNATWRTHLGMYRRTSSIHRYQHETSSGDTTSTSTDNTDRSVKIRDSTDQLSEDRKGYDYTHCAAEGFRKFSAPAALSRQLSGGSFRSTHPPASPYYPFPQLKSPKKSEAARRLGLYSSF